MTSDWPAEADPDWSPEWPTAPGAYWFHGYTSDLDRRWPARTRMARVNIDGAGRAMVVADGNFIYRTDGAEGWWRPTDVPPTPRVVEGVCVALLSPDRTCAWASIRAAASRWEPGALQMPGGKVDPGESPEAAAVRELREETGLVLDQLDLRLARAWHIAEPGSTGAPYLLHAFAARPGLWWPERTEPEKAEEWRLLPLSALHLGRAVITSARLTAAALLDPRFVRSLWP